MAQTAGRVASAASLALVIFALPALAARIVQRRSWLVRPPVRGASGSDRAIGVDPGSPDGIAGRLCEELSDGRLDYLAGGEYDGGEIAMVACNMAANMFSNGTVVASPSDGTAVIHEYPDGTSINENDYRYMWQRDAGLTMRTLMRVAPRSGQYVRHQVEAYAALLHGIWSRPSPNKDCAPRGACSILGEPRFFVDGSVYDKPWGRTQDDGPAINAMVLMEYLEMLEDVGHSESNSETYQSVKEDIISALNYVGGVGEDSSIDPWEMLFGQHFFVQAIQSHALAQGAAVAGKRGWEGAGNFSRWASRLQALGREHWDASSQVVRESMARPSLDLVGPKCAATSEPGSSVLSPRTQPCELDIATLLGSLSSQGKLDSGLEPVIAPYDIKMLSTVRKLVDAMAPTYEVNRLDDAAGLPGVLIGRYPGDEYSGVIMSPANATPVCEGYNCGSVWFLATHALAELLFSLAAAITKLSVESFSAQMVEFLQWACDLALVAEERGGPSLLEKLAEKRGQDLAELGSRLISAGDGVLRRARSHASPRLHMSEQIYRGDSKLPGVPAGAMIGARDLTWSYASLLDAMAARHEAMRALGALEPE